MTREGDGIQTGPIWKMGGPRGPIKYPDQLLFG